LLYFGFNEVDDCTVLCLALVAEAFTLYENVTQNLMLSGVEEGKNLMLTRLTPEATLVITSGVIA